MIMKKIQTPKYRHEMDDITRLTIRWFITIMVFSLLMLTLGGCGGKGDVSCTPPPQITSSPPTEATVGQQYIYYVDSLYNCFFWVCKGVVGVQLPPGAVLDYSIITWTPSADYANTDVRFEIATERDACGDSVTQSWYVHVYAAPVIESFSAARTAISVGESTTLTAVFQGSGLIEGLGPVTSGVPIATPALAAGTSYTLVVTNDINQEVRRTLTIQVLEPPKIQSMSASPAVITSGSTSTLIWSATGDFSVARLDPIGADVMQLSSFFATPSVTTTYVLHLSNATGESASASVQVVVVAPPVIESFTATPSSSVFQGTVSLTAQYHDGISELSVLGADGLYANLGPMVPGASVSSGELLRSTYFRLVVRNAAGTTAEQSLLVPITGPGTFQPTSGAPVVAARYDHTATRLLDGRVFIAGGYVFPETEIFDPATETFVRGPALFQARSGHAAALLTDGRVLLFGGYRTDGSEIYSAEIYDPSSGTVTRAGSVYGVLPEAALLTDGRVLVLGWSWPSQVFNPPDNTFTSVGPFNASHFCVRVERLADGSALVIEGKNTISSEVFSPGPDSFALTDTITHDRCGFASAVLQDGRVLVTGGGSTSAPAEIYDPATGVFSDVGAPQYPASFSSTASTLANGSVLVAGGGSENLRNSPWAELFDPATGTFAMMGGMNRGRENHTATTLKDGRVLVFGGCSMLPCYAELYTPQ
jgi:hypothetical protein